MSLTLRKSEGIFIKLPHFTHDAIKSQWRITNRSGHIQIHDIYFDFMTRKNRQKKLDDELYLLDRHNFFVFQPFLRIFPLLVLRSGLSINMCSSSLVSWPIALFAIPWVCFLYIVAVIVIFLSHDLSNKYWRHFEPLPLWTIDWSFERSTASYRSFLFIHFDYCIESIYFILLTSNESKMILVVHRMVCIFAVSFVHNSTDTLWFSIMAI